MGPAVRSLHLEHVKPPLPSAPEYAGGKRYRTRITSSRRTSRLTFGISTAPGPSILTIRQRSETPNLAHLHTHAADERAHVLTPSRAMVMHARMHAGACSGMKSGTSGTRTPGGMQHRHSTRTRTTYNVQHAAFARRTISNAYVTRFPSRGASLRLEALAKKEVGHIWGAFKSGASQCGP